MTKEATMSGAELIWDVPLVVSCYEGIYRTGPVPHDLAYGYAVDKDGAPFHWPLPRLLGAASLTWGACPKRPRSSGRRHLPWRASRLRDQTGRTPGRRRSQPEQGVQRVVLDEEQAVHRGAVGLRCRDQRGRPGAAGGRAVVEVVAHRVAGGAAGDGRRGSVGLRRDPQREGDNRGLSWGTAGLVGADTNLACAAGVAWNGCRGVCWSMLHGLRCLPHEPPPHPQDAAAVRCHGLRHLSGADRRFQDRLPR